MEPLGPAADDRDIKPAFDEALQREREAHRAAQDLIRRAAFLSEASRLLGESLNVEAMLDQVAHLCVPTWADWCSLHLIDGGRQIRLVAVAAKEPEQEAWARGFLGIRHPLLDAGGLALVIDDERSVVLDRPPAAFLKNAAPPGKQKELAEQLRFGSLVCAPLTARGCCFGALLLANREPEAQFSAADRALAEDLALRSAVAVDNAMLYQEATEAARVRDEIIAVTSHELRTPLAVITLELERLLKKPSMGMAPSPDEIVQSGNALRTGVRRLSDLVESLLEARHIGDIRSSLVRQDMDLAEVVREVLVRFEATAERAGCPFLVRGLETPVEGRWDRIRVDQILTNLVANALKYGRGKPVEVALEGNPHSAKVTVVDHGIGIAAADLRRIFEPYRRAAPLSNFGGFGLGLYIARQLAEAHGGKIDVTSTPGQGAAFSVELPRTPA